MKLTKWMFGFALIFSTQLAPVQGQNACSPCDPCAVSNPCDLCDIDFCDMEFSAYVDALYWEVCKGDLFVGGDDVKYLNPEYDWGFRLGGVARWRNWDLGVRWTSFETKDSFKNDGNELELDFDYDVVDIEFGYTCCLDCGPVTFRPFAGAKLAWIDDKCEADDRGFDEAKIDYEGYGLYVGCSGRWNLCSFCVCDRNIPIAFVARASTGIMRSEFEQDVDGSENDDYKKECLFVPYHDVYVGLDFTFCDLFCGDANFQIGYEAQYWGWREYDDTSDDTHLGLGGLVLRFGTSF